MCRAAGEGGRRCVCAGTALANHNRRRRENRAIRRNVAEWARQHGHVAEFLGQPPNVAKEWIKAQGLDPQDFVDGVPRTVTAGPASDHHHPGNDVSSSAGSARSSVRSSSDASSYSGSGWTANPWSASDVQEQIDAVIGQQGGHRDERSLLAGSPVSVKTVGGGTNTTRLVELDNGVMGYFKPFGGENKRLATGFGHDSALQSLHEAAAWRLASQLGAPWSEIVPPVVIREIEGELGSFALERPGKPLVESPWHVVEWREAAFFDALIGQQDRHPNNYLVQGDRIALIDHGYTFATPGDYKNWSWLVDRRVHGEGYTGKEAAPALTYQERSLLQKLVDSPDVLGLEKVLQPDRSSALVARAKRMLASGQLDSDY